MNDSPRRPLRRAAVVAVVVFHLLLFSVRGAMSLWGPQLRGRPVVDGLDRATERYANLVGCEQDWRLFSAPVAREAAFPAWRLELSDGSAVTVRSAGEPAGGAFRVGGWQQRRLEDHLVDPPAERVDAPGWPLWEAAARARAAGWRRTHPDDPRSVRRVVLVRRLYKLPPPGQAPAWPAVSEADLAAFAPDGRAMP